MKRSLKKLLIFITPFVIVFALFVGFEPYDYFYIRGDAQYLSRPLSSMRELLITQPKNVILGDSRMANLNTDYIEGISGEKYTSLAFGGSTLNDSIELFWYAVEHTRLEKIVIGVSFYRFDDENYYADRIDNAAEMAENPTKHFTNIDTWGQAADNMGLKTKNFYYTEIADRPELAEYNDDPSSLANPEPELPIEMNEEGYRLDLAEYAGTIWQQCRYYQGGKQYSARIEEIIDYCDANSIALIFVITSCNRTIWDKVIRDLNLEFRIDTYKDFLKSRATVYDMEYYNNFARDDNNFFDGFHFVRAEKMHLARITFAGEDASDYCYKTTKDQYNEIKQLERETGQQLLPPLEWESGYLPPSPEEILMRN